MNSPKFIWRLVVLALTTSPVGGYGQNVAAAQPNAVGLSDSGSGSDVAAHKNTKALPGTSQFALGVADVIRVSVWKNPDLSQTVTIGPDGFGTTIGTLNVNLAYVKQQHPDRGQCNHGTYIDCAYKVQVRHGLAVSYRGLISDSGGSRVVRHVAQFTLAWNNTPRTIISIANDPH